MNKFLIFGLFALIYLKPSLSEAKPIKPSFPCEKAKTRIEKTICQSPELAEADQFMAKAYREKLNSMSNESEQKSLKKEQRAWLKTFTSCNHKKESVVIVCLLKKYRARTLELASAPSTKSPKRNNSKRSSSLIKREQSALLGIFQSCHQDSEAEVRACLLKAYEKRTAILKSSPNQSKQPKIKIVELPEEEFCTTGEDVKSCSGTDIATTNKTNKYIDDLLIQVINTSDSYNCSPICIQYKLFLIKNQIIKPITLNQYLGNANLLLKQINESFRTQFNREARKEPSCLRFDTYSALKLDQLSFDYNSRTKLIEIIYPSDAYSTCLQLEDLSFSMSVEEFQSYR